MSPEGDGNFMARYEVITIALRRLMDDLLSKMLYEVLALTRRYLILIVLWIYLHSPNVVYKSMYP